MGPGFQPNQLPADSNLLAKTLKLGVNMMVIVVAVVVDVTVFRHLFLAYCALHV